MTVASTGLLLILTSAVLISYEFLLVRLFSYIYWGDFGYFIIAIAMFGFSLSGVLIAIYRSKKFQFSKSHILILTLITAVSILAVPHFFFLIQFEPMLIFHYISQFLRLFTVSLLLGLPFLLGYFLIGMILIDRIKQIGLYYGLNLLGSAAGGVLFTFVLTRYPFAVQLKILSFLLLIPLILNLKKKMLPIIVPSILFIVLLPLFRAAPSDFKDISIARNVPQYSEIINKNTPHGLLAVISSPLYRDISGLSLNFSGDIGGQYIIFRDGNILSRLPLKLSHEKNSYYEYLPTALPYIIRKPQKVLYLYSEGGLEWLKGPYFKIPDITFTVGNSYIRKIIEVILNKTAYYGVNPDSIKMVAQGERNFLERTEQKFDLIEVILTGGSAYGGGMRSNYILTPSGLIACLEALTENGILSITTKIKNPPRIMLRMMNLIVEVGKKTGIEIDKHLFVYRGWNTATFLFSAGELTRNEINKSLIFLDKCSFDPVYFNGITEDLVNRHNRLKSAVYFKAAMKALGQGLLISDSQSYLNLTVPTDEQPFFYYFNRFFKAIILFLKNKDMAVNLITLNEMMLFLTFIISLILGCIFLVFPAVGILFRQKKEIPFLGILYFLSIGFGFLFIEILLIQKVNRFTGDYLISFIVVLTGMLVSAGMGSWLLAPIVKRKKRFMLLTLLFLSIFYLALYLMLDFNFLYKTYPVVFFVLAGILGIGMSACMGVYFPCGMSMVNKKGSLSPAWMWAFNGLASVIAPVTVILISIEAGFHTIFVISILLYITAAGIYLIKKEG